MSEVKLMVGQKWIANNGSEVEITGNDGTYWKGKEAGSCTWNYHDYGGWNYAEQPNKTHPRALKTLIFCPSWPTLDKESPVLDLNNHKVGDKFNSRAWGEGEIVAKRRDLWVVFYNQDGNTASVFQNGKVLGDEVLHSGDLVSVVKKTVVMWVVRWGEDGKYCGVYDKQTEAEAAARLSSSLFAIKQVELTEGEGIPLPTLPEEEKKWVIRTDGGLFWRAMGEGTTHNLQNAHHYGEKEAKEIISKHADCELIPAPLA